MRISKFVRLFLAAVPLVAPASMAFGVDFGGQRIQILVPYEAGGGTDVYARFLAPLLSRALPGQPAVFVQNVPGAGAIAGGNQFEERARPDGLTLIAIGTSLTANYVFRDERVRYDVEGWIPIINSPSGTVVYARDSLGVSDVSQIGSLRDANLVMGANNATGGDLRVLLSLDGLGLKAREVFGLNRGDARPSFERGEFNLNFDSTPAYQSYVVPMVESGLAVPLFSFGVADENGEVIRDPLVADVPTYIEAYRTVNGEDPDGVSHSAWLAMFNLNIMAAKGLALPAGTPRDIVDAYHEAIESVVAEFKNPAYQEQADDIIGPYPQVIGMSGEDVLVRATDLDDEAFAWLSNWLNENYQINP